MDKIIEKYIEKYITEGAGDMTPRNAFIAGWRAAMSEIDRVKQAKQVKRRGKHAIDVYDFARDFTGMRLYCKYAQHEKGRQVATDGRYLLVHNAAYDADKEGKALDRDGVPNSDVCFPNYKRVLPYDIDEMPMDSGLAMQHVHSENCLALADLDNILAPFKNIRRYDRLLHNLVLVEYEDGSYRCYAAAILKAIQMFKRAYPEAQSYVSVNPSKEFTENVRFLADRQTHDILCYMLCNYEADDAEAREKCSVYSVSKHDYIYRCALK